MKAAHILKTIDYTLKRKGEKIFTIVDENGNYLNFGSWKTKKACVNAFFENIWKVQGYELATTKEIVKHQNYSHWANFEFAK